MAENKHTKEWKAILIMRIVVLAYSGMKILLLAPLTKFAQGFGNGCRGEFLMGQIFAGCLNTSRSLDTTQLRRMDVLVFVRTAHCMHEIVA